MPTPSLDHLARRELLQRIYDKMTDEERRLFVMMTLQHRSTEDIIRALAERQHRETMQALQAQREQMERMEKRLEDQSWLTGFGSDLLANFTSTGILWLASRLFRR